MFATGKIGVKPRVRNILRAVTGFILVGAVGASFRAFPQAQRYSYVAMGCICYDYDLHLRRLSCMSRAMAAEGCTCREIDLIAIFGVCVYGL